MVKLLLDMQRPKDRYLPRVPLQRECYNMTNALYMLAVAATLSACTAPTSTRVKNEANRSYESVCASDNQTVSNVETCRV
jgi:hypothetical protein